MHTTMTDESYIDNNDIEQMFRQNIYGIQSKTWFLLDNQNFMDQSVNSKYLKDIHNVNRLVEVFCNAGSTFTDQQGTGLIDNLVRSI